MDGWMDVMLCTHDVCMYVHMHVFMYSMYAWMDGWMDVMLCT